MDSTRAVDAIEIPCDAGDVAARSLYGVLTQVRDRRGLRGRRYSAGLVLTLLTLAKMAGESKVSGSAHWVRLHLESICQELNLPHQRLPCANTYTYVCEQIDLQDMNQRLRAFFEQKHIASRTESVRAMPPARGERHLALDGKSLCGTARLAPHPQAAVPLVNL